MDKLEKTDLYVDYGSKQAGEKRFVLRKRKHFKSNLFESNSKSEVIAKAQELNGWPVDGDERSYGRQVEESRNHA